ncbi:MAG: hypothetical protein ACYCYI_06265 [Saccharofermentanales bacterium]
MEKDKVTFTIEGEQFIKLTKFVEEHKKCKGLSAGEKFNFSFIPSLLGDIVTVSCTCGKSIYLTDI